MINIQEINGFEAGKRHSFEALIKILAQRHPPEGAHEFQPYDGRGGDGGVEAIWKLMDGSKIGYQSKFFSTLGEPQWKQMDKSVTQALKTHPEIKIYIFALPIDFTPDRGPKAKGKSQQEKWDTRVAAWKALAAKSSISIDFEYWGATALSDKLLHNENQSLQRYWFGGDMLDDRWFKKQVQVAVLKLDDRFSPSDHVEVSIESMLDAIVRGPNSRNLLHNAFKELEIKIDSTIRFATTSPTLVSSDLEGVQQCWLDIVKMRELIEQKPSVQWDWQKAQELLDRLSELSWELESSMSSIEGKDLEELDQNMLVVMTTSLGDLRTTLVKTKNIFGHQDWSAERKKCAFILGEAGSGKSHSIGQAATRRVEDRLPTIVILGQDLAGNPFWPQLAGILGIDGNTADDILGVLDSAGARKAERTLLLFDAINEGVGATYWKHWIPEVIEALRPYQYIAVVFTCRDVYARYAIPENQLDTIPTFKIRGFYSPDERENAAIQYLDKKGISRPNTPWLSPEFSNPLFLKTTSEALLKEGKIEFPRGLQGVSSLMALFFDAIASRIGARSVRAEDISSSLKKYVQCIAEIMATNGRDYVELSTATSLAQDHFGSRHPPEGRTWLDLLIQTNLFRRDPPPFEHDIAPLNPRLECVRFSYQRFQDYLMADVLTEKVIEYRASFNPKLSTIVRWSRMFFEWIGIIRDCPQTEVEFGKNGPLNFIFWDDETCEQFRYEYAGLVGSLSTIYPERLGVEFAMQIPNWKRQWKHCRPLQEGFIESFKWRRVDAFFDNTRELLNTLNREVTDLNDLFLEVSISIDHPYNAKFLDLYLKEFSLADRDNRWTRWINEASGKEYNQIDRIVSWALSTKDRKTDFKHMELASLVLAWALTSSHLTLRDRSTKALTALFLNNLDLFNFVFEMMKPCDDPYVIERLYAAAFGACCIDPNSDRLRNFSKVVYGLTFAKGAPPIALMTRDYALGIVELAAFKGSLDDRVRVDECYHPFGSEIPDFSLTKKQLKKSRKVAVGDQFFCRLGANLATMEHTLYRGE